MTTAPDRPRMRLLEWQKIGKGALIGKAKIVLPIGLEISDIAVFEKAGRRWAQFPAEPMRDAEGQPITDENGKVKYRSSIRWATRELQERFSETLIALIEAGTMPPPRPDPGRSPQRLAAARRQNYQLHKFAGPPDGGGRPCDDDISDIGYAP